MEVLEMSKKTETVKAETTVVNKEENVMTETKETIMGNNYGYNYYGQPQAPAANPYAGYQGTPYTTADMSAVYGQQAPVYGANPYGAPYAQPQWAYKPGVNTKAPNYLSKEDVNLVKKNKNEETWVVSEEEDVQARCLHKAIDGPNAGNVDGHEIPNGVPGAWHCDTCELDWIITDCSQSEFDSVLNFVFNVINTDKAKITNCPKSVVDGVLKAIPLLGLMSKFHRMAAKDFGQTEQARQASFTQAQQFGFGFPGAYNGFAQPGFAQPGFAYQAPNAQPAVNPYANPYQQPANPYAAPANPYAAPANPYAQVTPQYPQAPANPYAGTGAGASSPLIAAQPTTPVAPAAPTAATAPNPYAPTNTVTPDVTKTNQTI